MSLDSTFTEVYAVPGERSIIDAINPATGLTYVYGSTEAEVKAREPRAVRMPWAVWRDEQAKTQATPITWVRTNEHQYREMLEILPPAVWTSYGFLVGEPTDHDYTTGRARFQAYVQHRGQYFRSSRPLTVDEFKKYGGRI